MSIHCMARLSELIHFEHNPKDTTHLISYMRKSVRGIVLKSRYSDNVILNYAE